MRARSWYSIKNAAAKDETEVFIYDEISLWGVDAAQFVRDLAAVQAPTINVRINSPGGNVFDGVTIYNALRRHHARVVAHVDGLAASIASVIALGADEVRMAEGAFFMTHHPHAVAYGTAAELREMADVVDKVGDSLVGIYVNRTGATEKQVRAWMDAETWFNAQEAVDAGFADSVSDAPAVEAAFDLSRFKHVPERIAARARPGTARRIETIRDFETFLRDEGGFSHAAARAIAASGFKAPSDPRDEDGELDQVLAALERRGKALTTLKRG